MGHLPAELALHTAREAFRVARTPGAVWGTDTLNDILEQFERVLAVYRSDFSDLAVSIFVFAQATLVQRFFDSIHGSGQVQFA